MKHINAVIITPISCNDKYYWLLKIIDDSKVETMYHYIVINYFI